MLGATQRATGVLGAGFIENANQRLVLHTEGQSLIPQQLAGIVLKHVNGGNVTLGDIAHVVDGPEPPIGAAAVDGEKGVVLVVSAQYGANTRDVTRDIEADVPYYSVATQPDQAGSGKQMYEIWYGVNDQLATSQTVDGKLVWVAVPAGS